MEKSMQEKLNTFLRRHKNLNIPKIQEMVREYAISDLELARSYFTKKYGVSQSVFYKSRDFAVTNWLVDDSICKKLKEKSVANYTNHNPNGNGIAAIANFKELLQKREEYLLDVPEDFIMEIANMYAQGKEAGEIAYYYSTSISFVRHLLMRGIQELIIPSKIFEEIISLMPDKSCINHIMLLREINKKTLLNYQASEIKLLKYKVSNYPSYFRLDSEIAPTISELKEELKKAEERYQKTMREF